MTDGERLKRTREQIEFAAADTVCFFAPYPAALTKLQQEKWQPVIDKINAAGCDFRPSTGFEVRPLSDRTKAFLEQRLNALSDEAFNAFCAVSGGCRSVILALHVLDGFLSADQAFDLAVLEETYQNRFWTADEEAAAARQNRRQAVIRVAGKLIG